jgi:hypothetical protein
MQIIHQNFVRLLAVALVTAGSWCLSASAQTAPALTIEGLLQQGWEVGGYASTADNRSSLILFQKPGQNYLVQCSTLYDVTRSQRIITNCYELH